MRPENAAFIITLFVVGGISGFLSICAGIRYTRTGVAALPFLLLATTVYVFGYAFELTNSTLHGMLFWIKVEYLGISMIPPLWIIAVIQYAGKDKWLTSFRVAALFFIPVITLVLNYTNDYHHLYYSAVSVNNELFPHLWIKRGAWYWVNILYINASLVYCAYLLVKMWLGVKQPAYRRQIAVMLAGSLVPWAGNIIYQSGNSPYGLDLSPFAFTISALIFSWGVFRYQIFEIVPIARDIVFESMRDGVLVLDNFNRIVDFNNVAQNIIEDLSSDKIGCPVQEVLKSYPKLLEQIFSSPDVQEDFQIYQGEKRCYYNFRFWPVIDHQKRLLGKTVVFADITEHVILLDKLRTLAITDNLTNVFNRNHFFELCQKEIDRARRYGRSMSLILMDIDHFKNINDTYGHAAGDWTLKAIVDECRNCLREQDIFGRYGGEEFTIFLPETNSEGALEVAERLREKIAGIRLQDHAEVAITASFGVVSIERAGDVELKRLLKNADQALYRAKEAGRNRVSFVLLEE